MTFGRFFYFDFKKKIATLLKISTQNLHRQIDFAYHRRLVVEKNPASYKFEKRKKEIARQKKQEEKRKRQLEKKQGKLEEAPLISPDGTPITPLEEIDIEIHLDDNVDPIE